MAALEAGEGEDLSALAAFPGFADHAHGTCAFTQVIGVPPGADARTGAGDGSLGLSAVGAQEGLRPGQGLAPHPGA